MGAPDWEQLWPSVSPHTNSTDCKWEFGKGFWLEDEEEAYR